jgi:hypothetical protein
MDGNPAAQVRQGEGCLSIASVGGANQVEQGVVLRDGYQASIAERPAGWGEISAEHPDLANKR